MKLAVPPDSCFNDEEAKGVFWRLLTTSAVTSSFVAEVIVAEVYANQPNHVSNEKVYDVKTGIVQASKMSRSTGLLRGS